MHPKVICDPVHKHIYIDREKEKLILDLIQCKEIQRLRRIRQLGVSNYTYPSAEHSRFSHALGTFHLMKVALEYIKNNEGIELNEVQNLAALTAALLHDIGHGPFSHLLEDYGGGHEKWTTDIINCSDSEINSMLIGVDSSFPALVNDILQKTSGELSWVNALLSSQIDVDRMDYLLRDSHFCGIAYGEFDIRWIFHTLRLQENPQINVLQPVWIEKALRAIEEYIFARYNMYWAVYYHRTTRSYEELLKTIFNRAEHLLKEGKSIDLLSENIGNFIRRNPLTFQEYISLDDYIIHAQINQWRECEDEILKDLCQRFLERRGFKWVDPHEEIPGHIKRDQAHKKIDKILKKAGLDSKYYRLESVSAAKAYDYYHGERKEEQTVKNSILIKDDAGGLNEISTAHGMDRLRVITGKKEIQCMYYIPDEYRKSFEKILSEMKN